MNCQTCPDCKYLSCSRKKGRDSITAKTHNSIETIPIKDILYFRSKDKYTEVHYSGGILNITDPLHALADEFNDIAVRVQRSYVVMIDKVSRIVLDWSQRGYYRRHYAQMINGDELPISRRSVVKAKERILR